MAHTHFSDDALINSKMKNGNWRTLIDDDNISILEIKNLYANTYALEDAIFDRLEFYYNNKSWVVRLEDDDNLNNKKLERMTILQSQAEYSHLMFLYKLGTK